MMSGLKVAVFFSGSNAAPDVALSFVHVQYRFDLQIERPVKERQPLGNILVN